MAGTDKKTEKVTTLFHRWGALAILSLNAGETVEDLAAQDQDVPEWRAFLADDQDEAEASSPHKEKYVYIYWPKGSPQGLRVSKQKYLELSALLGDDDEKKKYLYKLRFEDYITFKKDHLKSVRAPSSWLEIAAIVGLADAAWMFSCTFFVPLVGSSVLGVALLSVANPLVMGALTYCAYLWFAKRAYRLKHGHWPEGEDLKAIQSDAQKLAIKVMAGVLGWTVMFLIMHYLVVPMLMTAVGGVAGLIVAHLVAAIAIGFGEAIAVGIANAANEGDFFKVFFSLDNAKLMVAVFIAGALWYGISFIPVLHLIPHDSVVAFIHSGVTALVQTLVTFASISVIFYSTYKGLEKVQDATPWGDQNPLLSRGFFSDTLKGDGKVTADMQTQLIEDGVIKEMDGVGLVVAA